jgi:hypothetical protein
MQAAGPGRSPQSILSNGSGRCNNLSTAPVQKSSQANLMQQDKPFPISVIALRADDYSPDGKNAITSLTTKYSTAERRYSVPVEYLYDGKQPCAKIISCHGEHLFLALQLRKLCGMPQSQSQNWLRH